MERRPKFAKRINIINSYFKMKFKLSKYLIYSDSFNENGDTKEYHIIFSCRKKMGIKVHAGLINILNKGLFDLLPDNIFSTLMYYEIIIPNEENEEINIIEIRKLYLENQATNESQCIDINLEGDLESYLIDENKKLNKFIQDGLYYDFLGEDYKSTLLIIKNNNIDFIPIDSTEITKISPEYYQNISFDTSYILPIGLYESKGRINTKNIEKIIDNFKLMLLLKYKINTKQSK